MEAGKPTGIAIAMPNATEVFDCLSERHPFAVMAVTSGLDDDSARRITAIAERQRRILGDTNYTRLVGMHTKNIEARCSREAAIEQTMFDFAYMLGNESESDLNATLDWWYRFVCQIESLVYGNSHERN